MSFDPAADLDVFLADHGTPVVFAGAPAGTRGIYDAHTEGLVGGDEVRGVVNADEHTVLVKTSVAALLSQRMALTVRGDAYRVSQKLRVWDGLYTLVTLNANA